MWWPRFRGTQGLNPGPPVGSLELPVKQKMSLVQKLLRVISRAEVFGALVFVLLGVLMLLESSRFPNLPWGHGGSPAFLPQILSVLLLLLAPLMAWEARKKPATSIIMLLPKRGKRLLMGSAVLWLFATPTILLPYLGFLVTMFLFMLAVMLAAVGWPTDYKRALKLVAAALLVPAAIYVAFTYFAKVQLPKGVLVRWP